MRRALGLDMDGGLSDENRAPHGTEAESCPKAAKEAGTYPSQSYHPRSFDQKWPGLEKIKIWYSMNEKETQVKASFEHGSQASRQPIMLKELSESASQYGVKRLSSDSGRI